MAAKSTGRKRRGKKAILKRSRRPTTGLKVPRRAPDAVVAEQAAIDADAAADFDPQPGSSKSTMHSVADMDPQTESSKDSINEPSKRTLRSMVNAEAGCSSQEVNESKAVSKITVKVERNLKITPNKMNKYNVYRPAGITTKDVDGNVFWRDNDMEEWKLAVYHGDIRDELIAACAQEGQYLYPREVGYSPNDITSFHPAQANWGFKRYQRPEILHQYEKVGHKNPMYPVPLWIHKGQIVLDHEDHPILAFRNMPATISSKVEGGLQEAISREDSRIDVKDFRARMMANSRGRKKGTRPTLSAISMRRSRFRWRAGYLSWTTRTGSQDIKDYLDELLPDSCKIRNSTKGWRDLRRSEVKLMTKKNRNKHLKRAGTRSITDEKRKEVDDLFYKSIEDAKAQEMHLETEQEQQMLFQGDEDYETEADYPGIVDLRDYDPDQDTELDDQVYAAEPSVRQFSDYRFATPQNRDELRVIFCSLEPTRRAFLEQTNRPLPVDDARASYAKQWVYLHRRLMQHWEYYDLTSELPSLPQSEKPGWHYQFPQVDFHIDYTVCDWNNHFDPLIDPFA